MHKNLPQNLTKHKRDTRMSSEKSKYNLEIYDE